MIANIGEQEEVIREKKPIKDNPKNGSTITIERIINLLGSCASLLGLSFVSVFALVKSFKNQAADIGIRLILSSGAFFCTVYFGALFGFLTKKTIATVVDIESLNDEQKSKLYLFYIILVGLTCMLVFIGLLILVWSVPGKKIKIWE